MLATIDVLSRGRVTVGVGVGWLREEFQALGAPDFDRRGAVSDEYLRIFKTLWTQDPGHVPRRVLPLRPHPLPAAPGAEAAPADLDRRPQQGRAAPGRAPGRRLASGGRQSGRPAAPGRAARGARRPAPSHRGGASRLLDAHDLLQGADLRPAQGVDGGAERRPFSGSQQAIADDIGAFAGLGVSELIFDFRAESLSESLDRMARFAPLIRSFLTLSPQGRGQGEGREGGRAEGRPTPADPAGPAARRRAGSPPAPRARSRRREAVASHHAFDR